MGALVVGAVAAAAGYLARDPSATEHVTRAPGDAAADDAERAPSNGRSPRSTTSSVDAEVVDALDDASTRRGPMTTRAAQKRRPSGALPRPGKRGSILDTADPCEPLVEPGVPASFQSVHASGMTVAWPPSVEIAEPTSLAYVVAGLVEEAAQLTGTDPRDALTVFLHASTEDLHLATDTPEWTTGVYDGAVHVVAEPRVDFGVRLVTLRHEVMHAQLHAGVGCMPAWFNEGVAQYFAGRPPTRAWLEFLKTRASFDFDALSVPTIVEAEKEDAPTLYATSLAMLLFEIDRRTGGIPRIVDALQASAERDPRRRARSLWRDQNPSTTSSDVRDVLARRLFGVSSERDLENALGGQVCCTGERRLSELACRIDCVD